MDANIVDAPKLEEELKDMYFEPMRCLQRHKDLYGREIHFYTHCHIKAYDRTGEGIKMDRSFMDKYGAPISLENYWMEGYHCMDRMLALQLLRTDNDSIPMPPVAGYVGCAHLYKPGTDHGSEPWNWTGWIPRWQRGIIWDPKSSKNRLVNNRFFMGLRANEIQNNAWDYHPVEDCEGPYAGIDASKIPEYLERTGNAEHGISPGKTDKFRGGFFFEGNSWGRYVHLNLLKSHAKDFDTGDFKRYSWIVHPLAYRATLNQLPDNNCVDAIQWCVFNIGKDPVFNNPSAIPGTCNGIELFNDFTYTASYNQELITVPIEAPDFRIPCFNGEKMHCDLDSDHDDKYRKYNWWFDTYPFEFGEFLLTSGLSRGIWLHPLSANDVGYMDNTAISGDIQQSGTLANDTKSFRKGNQNPGDVEALCKAYQGAKNYDTLEGEFGTFVKGLPYGADTAFGYTTIIDPTLKLKGLVNSSYNQLMKSSEFGMNRAEESTIDYLLKGQHYAHTGVYGLFSYQHESAGEETFPIQIQGQVDVKTPCYQMNNKMDLVFIFHPPNEEKTSSFTHDPSQFIWKYEAQFTTDDEDQEVTVHGYFNLHDGKKTRLDLSQKYNKENLKWIRFLTFELTSPQQRAWFVPIKGLAFGRPRNLLQRVSKTKENPKGYKEVVVPKLTNQVAVVEIASQDDKVVTLKEADEYFKQVHAVQSSKLKFFFEHNDSKEAQNQMLCYFFQACPHRQNVTELSKHLRKTVSEINKDINDPVLPPRILQNIHGYVNIAETFRQKRSTKGDVAPLNLSTRLDLCNQWDYTSVKPSAVEHEDGKVGEPEPVVFFYAIDTKPREPGMQPYKPVKLATKPEPINCTYNVFKTESQMWKVEGEKLLNKLKGFKTEDIWTTIAEGQMVYIENKTKNEVLTVEENKVKLVDNKGGCLWNKGTPDQDGWYTLTWGPTNQILTFNQDTKGDKINKDDEKFTLTDPTIWKNTCPIEKISSAKSWNGREEVKIAPKVAE